MSYVNSPLVLTVFVNQPLALPRSAHHLVIKFDHFSRCVLKITLNFIFLLDIVKNLLKSDIIDPTLSGI